MEKYKKFLENQTDAITVIMAIACAIFMLIFIIAEMSMTFDFRELENHYVQLEMVKEDTTTISELKNADISISDSGMTVTLKGKYHNLNAVFDENDNYVKATVSDNRIGSNLIISALAVVVAAAIGYGLSYILLLLLYIPIGVYVITVFFKKKFAFKKAKK